MKEKQNLIYKQAPVKGYQYGNNLELTTGIGPKKQSIKVISNKRYVNLETGEIKKFNTDTLNRSDSLEEIKRTMKKLRRLIAHNFDGGKNQLWITLTYREHITDSKVASNDFKIFMKQLRRKYKNIEYITVIEPQETGKWHFHVLLKSNRSLYIHNSEMENMWRKGFTKTKRLKRSDKVGNYVLAYLTDLKLPNESKNSSNKKIAKGVRLYLYPKGMRIYRRSKGIEDPPILRDTKMNILKKYHMQNMLPSFSKKTSYKNNDQEYNFYTEIYNNIPTKSSSNKKNQ